VMSDAAAWVPVIVATLAFVGAVVATWLKDRNNPATQAVLAANSVTAQMQMFIAPLQARIAESEKRIGELTVKVTQLEDYVATLQDQIRELGAEPIPFGSHQRYRIPKNEGDES